MSKGFTGDYCCTMRFAAVFGSAASAAFRTSTTFCSLFRCFRVLAFWHWVTRRGPQGGFQAFPPVIFFTICRTLDGETMLPCPGGANCRPASNGRFRVRLLLLSKTLHPRAQYALHLAKLRRWPAQQNAKLPKIISSSATNGCREPPPVFLQ